MRKFSIIITYFLVFSVIFNTRFSNAISAEVDTWTGVLEPLTDGTQAINETTNDLIQQALLKANQKSSCNKKDLYKEMRKSLRFLWGGKFIKWLHHNKQVQRQVIKVRESIYRDLSVRESRVVGGLLKALNARLAQVMQVGPYRIGTDKFEHFLGSGFMYFRSYYLKEKDLDIVLYKGQKKERGILGGKSTGVISFGDLAANFNGMRFWNHVLAEFDDVLGEEYMMGPYIVCENKKWVQVQEVNWLNYIDEMFEEQRNCSAYRKHSISVKVASRIRELESEFGLKMVCDGSDEKVLNLRATKYAPVINWLMPLQGDHVAAQVTDQEIAYFLQTH